MASFIENASKLLTGQILASGITLLTLPIITRLYAPDSYGVYLLFSSMVMMLSPLVCLGFEKAVLIPKHRIMLGNVISVAVYSICLVTLLCAVAVTLWRDWLAQLLNMTNSAYLLLLPIGALLAGVSRLLNFLMIRTDRFSRQAVARVLEAANERIIGVAGGMLGSSVLWLIVARLVGVASGVSLLLFRFRNDAFHRLLTLNWRKVVATFKRYAGFILSSLAALLNALSRESPVLVLGVFFSTEIVSYYGLGRVAIGRPLDMLGDSLSKAFFHKASNANRHDMAHHHMVAKILRYPLALMLPPIFVIIIAADILVPVVFGKKWAEAGIYAQIMAAPLALAFIHRPLSIMFDVMRKQAVGLFFDSLLLVSIVCGVLIGADKNNPLLSVMSIATMITIIYAAAISYITKIVGNKLLDTFYTVLRTVVTAFLFMTPLLLLRFLYEDNGAYLIAAGSLGILLYYFYLYKSDDVISDRIRKIYQVRR